MGTLLTLLVLGLLVWFWVDSLRARETALRRCNALCAGLDVQLLDQTVRLVRLRPARGGDGRLRWWRRYIFEFSVDGVIRHPGEIVMFGTTLESISMEHPDGPIVEGPPHTGSFRA